MINPSQAIKSGWNDTLRYAGTLVPMSLVYIIISGLSGIGDEQKGKPAPSSGEELIGFIFTVVGFVLMIGLMQVFLDVSAGKTPEWRRLMPTSWQVVLKYLGASILFGLGFALLSVLLLVPGIIFGLTFGTYQYILLDREVGIRESFEMSRTLTKGNRISLLVFGFLSLGVIILGFLALGIGVLLALPVVGVAGAYMYRQLTDGEKSESSDVAE